MDRKEAIEVIQKNWPSGRHQLSEALQTLIPEFQESEDEKIKKEILELVSISGNGNQFEEIKDWLEKQGEPRMVKWKGDNLREVLEFTGKNENFDKWFTSFEEFEKYVHEHNDIFKIFNEDGSHYEIPVGAWIVKTPDGYNTPSRFGFVPRFAEWSEEDEKMINDIIEAIDKTYAVSDYQEMVTWLKSIKYRYTWKPSNEQMEALDDAVRLYKSTHFDSQHYKIESLYEDLKKLKGE